jgi:hypothetical protein
VSNAQGPGCSVLSSLGPLPLQFTFAKNAAGKFNKKVVEEFKRCGGFNSYLRLVSATQLDTLHTVEEVAKTVGQLPEEPVVLMQDQEKLDERKFHKFSETSVVLTEKLDGKHVEASTAYGFNTIKDVVHNLTVVDTQGVPVEGMPLIEFFMEGQFNPVWRSIFGRQVLTRGDSTQCPIVVVD